MKVEFLEPARAEFIEADQYYNDQREGLGLGFAEEVRATIERIIRYPESWSLISRRIRRCRTNHFPYGVIHQVKGEILLLITVMHLHREPRSWKSRIPEQPR